MPGFSSFTEPPIPYEYGFDRAALTNDAACRPLGGAPWPFLSALVL
jgi:hypothetical protein